MHLFEHGEGRNRGPEIWNINKKTKQFEINPPAESLSASDNMQRVGGSTVKRNIDCHPL